MYLTELLKEVEVTEVKGRVADTQVRHISCSTEDLQSQSMFFCIEGMQIDGHSLAELAMQRGAEVVVASKQVNHVGKGTIVYVPDTREAMALMSARYYGNPAQKLMLYGVTGTNGKTTTTYMLRSILEQSGIHCGMMGTICRTTGIHAEPSDRTTMESIDLHKAFAQMCEDGNKACVMEVSSHALALKRVFGVNFLVGVFTNLTQDHLDFHESMEDYFRTKSRLFTQSCWKVINLDDSYGRRIQENSSGNVAGYGIQYPEACSVSAGELHADGSFSLKIGDQTRGIRLQMPGRFNVYNALGAATAATVTGIGIDDVVAGLEALRAVPGRSERINTKYGFCVIIDYAHTPDGIVNILKSAREYTRGRLIVLFGCGGDRDRSKRAMMGEAAGSLADFCIVTSDNPRSENPMQIIDEILPGLLQTGCPYEIIADRKSAIAHAIAIAKKEDVIVLAGKGHETYQILAEGTIPFDERVILKDLLGKDEMIQ